MLPIPVEVFFSVHVLTMAKAAKPVLLSLLKSYYQSCRLQKRPSRAEIAESGRRHTLKVVSYKAKQSPGLLQPAKLESVGGGSGEDRVRISGKDLGEGSGTNSERIQEGPYIYQHFRLRIFKFQTQLQQNRRENVVGGNLSFLSSFSGFLLGFAPFL